MQFVKEAISLAAKNTDELQQALMDTPDLNRFLQENESSFKNRDLTRMLNDLLQKKGMSKAELAKHAATSEVYLYQLTTGRRMPSRNRMLCICLGLNATLEETQFILQQSGFATLYPANRRDAIIIHAIVHGQNLFELNDCLFNSNEETLY